MTTAISKADVERMRTAYTVAKAMFAEVFEMLDVTQAASKVNMEQMQANKVVFDAEMKILDSFLTDIEVRQ